jgi:hypothetical protein
VATPIPLFFFTAKRQRIPFLPIFTKYISIHEDGRSPRRRTRATIMVSYHSAQWQLPCNLQILYNEVINGWLLRSLCLPNSVTQVLIVQTSDYCFVLHWKLYSLLGQYFFFLNIVTLNWIEWYLFFKYLVIDIQD